MNHITSKKRQLLTNRRGPRRLLMSSLPRPVGFGGMHVSLNSESIQYFDTPGRVDYRRMLASRLLLTIANSSSPPTGGTQILR